MPGLAKKRRIRIAASIVVLSFLAGSAYVAFRVYSPHRPPDGTMPATIEGPPTIVIQSRIGADSWGKNTAIYPLKGQDVSLKVDEVPGASIRWYRILPDLSKAYNNCNFPWDKDPYKWKGFAEITYFRKELPVFRDRWEVKPFQTNHDRGNAGFFESLFRSKDNFPGASYRHRRVGSFWFQVEVAKNGKTQRSPGIEDSDRRGLSPKVLRVSVRDGEGYLGYVTSFFNVPGLFGSTPYQSRNYIGVDCADVLVAAYGKFKGKKTTKDYCAQHLVDQLPNLAETDVQSGTPSETILWREQIRRGDLIAVKYTGHSRHQHIGALVSDANRNGKLDGEDLLIHAGPQPLRYCRLGDGNFDGHVVLLRLDGSSLTLQELAIRRWGRDLRDRLRSGSRVLAP